MFAPGIARPVSARVGRQWPAVRNLFLKKRAARNLEYIQHRACPPWRASSIEHRFCTRPTDHPSLITDHSVRGGFTLLELLIVIGIIALLLVLIAPAFTYIKGGTDVTSGAYTIQSVLDTARTYAKANNTYTWVGFFEENAPPPEGPVGSPGVGRVVMSIVASKDGTMIYNPNNVAQQDLTTSVVQVGKLTKIDNVHLWTHTDTPQTPTGSDFDHRPNVSSTYCIGDASPSDSTTPFNYPVGNPAPSAEYTFVKAVQFSPRGEARINNSTLSNGVEVFPTQNVAEIALEPTHGAATPGSLPPKSIAIQFTGFGGSVKIYRK